MVHRGWSSAELMQMAESDFRFWIEHEHEFAKAEAAARQKAARRAGR